MGYRSRIAFLSSRHLIFLLAGRRPDAIRILEEAQRRDPSNTINVHAMGLASYHMARTLDALRHGQDSNHLWERAIAAWAMLLRGDGFWEKGQLGIQARYHVHLSKNSVR